MKQNRVLVVDDDPLMQTMLDEALSDRGYTVFVASEGPSALKLLDKEKVQVIICDLKMPVMNGVELCRKIKERQPATIIYAMSGYHSLFDLVDCLAAGFEDYFPKPFDFETIVREVEHAFEKLERWKRI